MKLNIDNIDRFNSEFGTNFTPRGDYEYEVDIASLSDVIDEDHFWRIVRDGAFYRGCLVRKAGGDYENS